MKVPILKMKENRVRRMYTGGAGIEKIHGRIPVDSDCPEEWIASIVEAQNKEMSFIEKEGISKIIVKDKDMYLNDIINSDPKYYIGEKQSHAIGYQIGVLVKLLDSATRLAIQVHPDSQYARKYLNSIWGKKETYYIADIRENVNPYIYLGFKRPMDKEYLKRLIINQKIEDMINCLNKISVSKGEVWYIPPGVVHAIGEGITMIEIMEPSDWVVRCEFERIPGKKIPPEARFMGKSLDEVIDIFDLNSYTVKEIYDHFCIKQVTLESNLHYELKQGISEETTDCYEMFLADIFDKYILHTVYKPTILIILNGIGEVENSEEKIRFKSGDSFLVAAEAENIRIKAGGDNPIKICIVRPKSY